MDNADFKPKTAVRVCIYWWKYTVNATTVD